MPEHIFDLHTHSDASDGTLSPAELVKQAHERGVNTLALTDHDTTAGLSEARAAVDLCGINMIDGVEVSAAWNGKTVHIVGLEIQPESNVLKEGLQQNLDVREQRAQLINEKLSSAGLASMEWETDVPTRTHFARHLVARGHAKNINQAFKRYLAKGKPAWVEAEWLPLDEAVQRIVQAGGIAVVAHPLRYKLTRARVCSLVEDFQRAGGRGIEVVSGHTKPDQLRDMVGISEQFGLLASRGSDFHDLAQVWAPLGGGPVVPEKCEPVWTHWLVA